MSAVPGETPYARVKALMARLRQDCPWDSTQSFETIAPYTIEEAYEVADAIERQDMASLRDELGDLLFQVLFHSILAEEQGAFDMDDVCDGLVEKMVRRHPDVYAGAEKPDWDAIKAQEREGKADDRILSGVAKALPALMRAEKLGKRASKVGFDWPDMNGVFEKVEEELGEVREAVKSGDADAIEDEIGDLLFAVTNIARKAGVDPEAALRRTNLKFTQRFNHVEDNSPKALKDMSLDEMEELWVAAKTADL
ncbi:nucleoside triphosphate pyrophosphohydrolase [Litorimonas sp. RW-G-Af-16]|uniref:nucleoside triphosphate pyrophosphohydrolase n=1 Tax=Litorimonas sp. RW-G-Af-16 TaxID=3241168 RepID=UPI00390C8EAC